jgi:hypothetical protein
MGEWNVLKHVLQESGPMRYPGGKDGMFHVRCSCSRYTSPPFVAGSRNGWIAAEAHKKAMEATQL